MKELVAVDFIPLVILAIIVFQNFFFGLFLLTQVKRKRTSNRLLAFLLITLGIHMAINLAGELTGFSCDPRLLIGLSALYGPLFYLHIISLQRESFQLYRKHLYHFIAAPLIVFLSFSTPDWAGTILRICILILVYSYMIAAIFSVKKYQKIIEQTQSSPEAINLSWTIILIESFLFVALFDLINNVFSILDNGSSEWGFILLLTALLAFINIIFFKALKQPQLFMGISEDDIQIYTDVVQKYAGSNIGKDELKQLHQQIDEYILSQKPYLNPDLTLKILADSVGIPSRMISQIINTHYATNFSDFINDHRIGEAKKLLIDKMDLTVLEIIYKVGFNSKSSFYDIFKLKTGLTPQQFRKSNGKHDLINP